MLLICHFRIQIWRQRGKRSWRKSEARRRNLKRKSKRTFRSRKVENRKRSCSRENRRKRRQQHWHLPETLLPVWLYIYDKFYFYTLTFSFWAAINTFALIPKPVKKKICTREQPLLIPFTKEPLCDEGEKKSLQIRLDFKKYSHHIEPLCLPARRIKGWDANTAESLIQWSLHMLELIVAQKVGRWGDGGGGQTKPPKQCKKFTAAVS